MISELLNQLANCFESGAQLGMDCSEAERVHYKGKDE